MRAQPHRAPYDHIQEDVLDGPRQLILYRPAAGRCQKCCLWVRQAEDGELLGSRVGPHARAMAAFLHTEIGVIARKVSRAIAGLTGLEFPVATFLVFQADLARKARPLVQDLQAKISSTEGPVQPTRRTGRSTEDALTSGFTRPAAMFTFTAACHGLERSRVEFWKIASRVSW